MISKPSAASVMQGYIDLVSADDALIALEANTAAMENVLSTLTEDQWMMRYEPSKWSIKELVVHISDAERIFGYRILRLLRQDATPLPGYEENWYASHSRADERTPSDILSEWKHVRALTQLTLSQAHPGDLDFVGHANGKNVTAREIAFAIVGHAQHHINILTERYLHP